MLNEKTNSRRSWLYLLRRGLYWIIPIIILYIIFQRINFTEFKLNILKTKPWLVALGICYWPAMILIGALRWKVLMTQYNRRKIKLSFALKHYWIGLSLGFFTPASLGWDGYRVFVSGRYFGQYALNIAVIIVEKIMALLTCTLMVIILYPMVPIISSLEIKKIIFLSYILFFSSIIIFAVIAFIPHNKVLTILIAKIEVYVSGLLKKISSRIGTGKNNKITGIPFNKVIEPLAAPQQLLLILILSLGIQFVAATGIQIFFQAVGYDLPFIANLFISPILFFIFILPISFGSLGIREGAYILLYGLFGVPAETALLVSFFGLSGILLNNLIGGLLMLFSNIER